MPMEVSVPAVSEILPGVVSAVHPLPDGTNKKYSIEITLQKGKVTLLPSMRAEAQCCHPGNERDCCTLRQCFDNAEWGSVRLCAQSWNCSFGDCER